MDLSNLFRQWYLKFHQVIISYDFTMIDEDHCVYVKRSKNKFMILSLYVDDILLVENDTEYLLIQRAWLSSNFEIKDMGKAAHILDVKITRDHSKRMLALSQESYIKKILERFHMQDCKPIDSLIVKD